MTTLARQSGQLAFEQTERGIVGRRHSPQCRCGCQFVDGLTGEIVQDGDTPKLAALGLMYVRFPVRGRDQTVCYDRPLSPLFPAPPGETAGTLDADQGSRPGQPPTEAAA